MLGDVNVGQDVGCSHGQDRPTGEIQHLRVQTSHVAADDGGSEKREILQAVGMRCFGAFETLKRFLRDRLLDGFGRTLASRVHVVEFAVPGILHESNAPSLRDVCKDVVRGDGVEGIIRRHRELNR